MKQYSKDLIDCLWSDKLNRILFVITLVLSLAVWLIWRSLLSSAQTYVYVSIGIYPVKLLALFLVINTGLAIFSYQKEREIAYLLLIANTALILLVLALEIFYMRIGNV
ncbi:MAG TPA: hypothetical protein PK263_01610 [bacterium]|nr:hypothetical protein [bacterium]